MNPLIRLGKGLLYPGLDLGSRSRKRIARFFLREPNIHTLDVGCGNGYFASLAARASPGGRALGISFDPDQIRRCNEFKSYMRAPAETLSFRLMNVEKLHELDEQFDQILFLEVIEHIDDDLAALKNIARLLAPNGIVHVTTPDLRYGHWCGTLDRHAAGGHCRIGYTAERLQDIIFEAGLDVAAAGKYGGLGNFLVVPQNAIAKALGHGIPALAVAFSLVYPFYLLLNFLPAPANLQMFHYVIGRKRGSAVPGSHARSAGNSIAKSWSTKLV